MIDADPDPSTASPSPASSRPLAVELWDVGCARRYAPLRRLFYPDAAGVPRNGGADASSTSRAAAVRPWIAELAGAAGGCGGLGGQAAPTTSSSLAGLPYPAALVGTKADRAAGGRKGTPAVLVDAVALGLAGGGWGAAAARAWRGLGMSRAASFTRRWSGVGVPSASSSGHLASAGGASPPPSRPGITSMNTAAADGDVDTAAFDDFFRRCAAGARGRVGGGGAHAAASSSAAASWGAAYGGGGSGAGVSASDGLGGDDDDLV